MQMKRLIHVCTASACLLMSAAAANAQYAEIARGLYLLGFRPDVRPNRLTGGVDATYFRGFSNSQLNYGVSTLTLTGGLTLDGSTSKRPFPGASFGIKSTSDPTGNSLPLSYTLTIPRAAEQITVTGTVNINTEVKVDQTGYYSVVANIENRGTVTGTGATNINQNIDYNVGPINQVGNVYLKALGGVVNAFGGPGDKIAGLPDTGPLFSLSQATDTKSLDSLDLNDPKQLETYVNTVLLQGITQAAMDPTIGQTSTLTSVVPEPSTLALLAMSVSFTYLGVRRRMGR